MKRRVKLKARAAISPCVTDTLRRRQGVFRQQCWRTKSISLSQIQATCSNNTSKWGIITSSSSFLSRPSRHCELRKLLTPRSRVFVQLLKDPHFMEDEGSLPPSYPPAICTYFSQMNPVRTFTSLTFILIFSHLCIDLPSRLFPSSFPTKTMYEFLFSPLHATCSAHRILLGLITVTIFGGGYIWWNFSLRNSCNFLYLSPDIFLITLFSNVVTLCSSLNVRHQLSRNIKQTKL